MGILWKMCNKSLWGYVTNFKDGYALAVPEGKLTVYLIDEYYEIAGSTDLRACLFDEVSVKKAISNNCKYLAAVAECRGSGFYTFNDTQYYTFIDTQLKEVEGHKYENILYYVPGKSAIVVEMNGDVTVLNGDLKKEKVICSSNPENRYVVVNQDYFYVTNNKTLKLVNIKTKEIKEFEGNHVEVVADGEFYKMLQNGGDTYYDKNFNFMEDYKNIYGKDKRGRIPIMLKNGEIFIYHCN